MADGYLFFLSDFRATERRLPRALRRFTRLYRRQRSVDYVYRLHAKIPKADHCLYCFGLYCTLTLSVPLCFWPRQSSCVVRV